MSLLPQLQISRVLANAGSGKTYKLSSAFLKIAHSGLTEGEPLRLERVLATTFTKASAADIRNKVLLRAALAVLDDGRTGSPSETGPLAALKRDIIGDGTGRFESAEAGKLLEALIASMDRLDIRTIDSFLGRIANASAIEMGLPLSARRLDDREMEVVVHEAITRIGIANEDRLTQLALLLNKGRHVANPLYSLLNAQTGISALMRIWEDSCPRGWHTLSPLRLPPAWVLPDQIKPVADATIPPILDELETLTAGSALNKPTSATIESIRGVLSGAKAEGELKTAADVGLLKAVVYGKTIYGKTPIPAPIAQLYRKLLDWIQARLTRVAMASSAATGELLQAMSGEIRRVMDERGIMTFDSITRRVGEYTDRGNLDDVLFRLDSRIDHILLDEFQDTSRAQWRAMQPLVSSLAAGGESPRSVLAVGDVKQSLYGWRGADPRLLRGLHRLLNESGTADLDDLRLATSYRSSPVILAAVDRLFQSLAEPSHPIHIDRDSCKPTVPRAVAIWMERYQPHQAAAKNANLPGCVKFVEVPAPGSKTAVLDAAGVLATQLWHRTGGTRSIAVITGTNNGASQVAHAIRSQVPPAPCTLRAGGTIESSAAAVAAMDLLRFAVDPLDTTALTSAMHSPLGTLLSDPACPRHLGGRLLVGWTPAWSGAQRSTASLGLRAVFAAHSTAATIDGLFTRLRSLTAPALDEGDQFRLARMTRLIESGEARGLGLWEIIAGLEVARLEDVPGNAIHAMNIHQSKGLEWDIVIFADFPFPAPREALAVGRGGELNTDSPDLVVKYMAERIAEDSVQQVMNSFHSAHQQEALSRLYVALTRAKQGLWFVTTAAQGKNSFASAALVRHAWKCNGTSTDLETHPAFSESWLDDPIGKTAESEAETAAASPIRARPSAARPSTRRAASPSELSETRDASTQSRIVTPPSAEAMLRGTIAHAVCETIEWIDDWRPDIDDLARRFAPLAPQMPRAELAKLVAAICHQLRAPEIANSLRCEAGAVAMRERRFLHLDSDDALRQGSIDRLVLRRDGSGANENRGGTVGGWSGATVFDFKTDALPEGASQSMLEEWLRERALHHKPQLDAYADAVAEEYRIDRSKVTSSLILLSAGLVVPVLPRAI